MLPAPRSCELPTSLLEGLSLEQWWQTNLAEHSTNMAYHGET